VPAVVADLYSVHRLERGTNAVADVIEPYCDVVRDGGAHGCWVMANMVCGLDGSAAMNGRVGALSSGADSVLFQRMRSLADVVLVGAETVRRERYGPVQLPSDLAAKRAAAGLAQPVLAIVSGSLDLPADLPLFEDPARVLVFTHGKSDPTAVAALGVEVIVAGESAVEPRRVIEHLAQRHALHVLCEGGPSLLGELFAADLVDEYFLSLAPLIGGDELPVVRNPRGAPARSFALGHVLESNGTLFLRYSRKERRD
jgi:riboflavin biosynthesis pyrimidine reductase